MSNEASKPVVDWELIERHYRAGIKTVRQLATDYGVSHTAIQKRATKFGWERDLTNKIRQATQNMVATKVVAKLVATETKLTDAATVKAYSEASTTVDLMQRDHVSLGAKVSRSQLDDLAEVSNKSMAEEMQWLREFVVGWKLDHNVSPEAAARAVAIFDATVSLSGRAKIAKDIAASFGVYIPMQRKIWKLDSEADGNQSDLDAMLAKINAST